MKIGSIVIDCTDFPRMMNFWQEALHYTPRRRPSPGWVVLSDPEGKNPNISINRASRVRRGRNRIHLDLYTDDPEGEVRRLRSLGAKLHRRREPGEDFVVLADPGGNLFCVVDTR